MDEQAAQPPAAPPTAIQRAHTRMLARASLMQSYGTFLIALLVILAFLAYLGVVLYLYATGKADLKETLTGMINALQNVFIGACGYFIGSSVGSAKKDIPPPTEGSQK